MTFIPLGKANFQHRSEEVVFFILHLLEELDLVQLIQQLEINLSTMYPSSLKFRYILAITIIVIRLKLILIKKRKVLFILSITRHTNCFNLAFMKKTIFNYFVLLVSGALLSCSSNNDSHLEQYIPINYKGIEKEIINSDFRCENSSNCPENVGIIYVNVGTNKDKPVIAKCTGFVIADDIIATNSHCIPDKLKFASEDCSDYLAIKFKGKGSDKVFKCKEVMEFSSPNIFAPDYAFFKVNSTKIKPLEIHKDGIKNGEALKIFKVDPIDDGGILAVETCSTLFNSMLNFSNASSWSKTTLGFGCKAVGGNSGSPVLNAESKVVGILQSKFNQKYNSFLKKLFSKYNLQLPFKIPAHIIFTNFSCVADPINGVFFKDKCDAASDINIFSCLKAEEFSYKKEGEYKTEVERWSSEHLPQIFKYKYIYDSSESTYKAVPICVKQKSQYKGFQKDVSLEGIYGFRKEVFRIGSAFKVKTNFSISLDDKFRPLSSASEKIIRYIYSSYELKHYSGKWEGVVHLDRQLENKLKLSFNILRTESVTLPECTSEQVSAEDKTEIILENGKIIDANEYQKLLDQKPAICDQNVK